MIDFIVYMIIDMFCFVVILGIGILVNVGFLDVVGKMGMINYLLK